MQRSASSHIPVFKLIHAFYLLPYKNGRISLGCFVCLPSGINMQTANKLLGYLCYVRLKCVN